MSWRPSAGEERRLALRARAKRWLRAGWIDDAEGGRLAAETATPWKVVSLFPRAGLFVLTVLLGAAAALLAESITQSGWTILVGFLLIAGAEHMIFRLDFFRTGIEEGLWVTGAFVVILEAFRIAGPALALATWFELALGVALLLLSLRLLHTLAFLAGVGFVVSWAATFFASDAVGGWILLAAGSIALAVDAAPAERPFRASAAGWLALGAPAIAWVLVRAESLPAAYAIAIAAAIVWIAAGIRFHSRFALSGGALAAAAFGFELLDARPWAPEWKLLAAGAATFALAVAIERWLRTPRRGFTSQALEGDAEPRLFEMAAVAAVAPAAATPREEGFAGGEGKFGGGGASGEY